MSDSFGPAQPGTIRDGVDAIRRLHHHRRWARLRAVELARGVTEAQRRQPFEMGPGSIMGLLVHLHGAEVVWLNVLEEIDPATVIPGADAFESLEALEHAWRSTDDRWARWLDALSVEALARPALRRRDGRDHLTSAGDVMLHVCTHQHYHLAQLMNMLRQLGALPKPAPSLDLITFARELWRGTTR